MAELVKLLESSPLTVALAICGMLVAILWKVIPLLLERRYAGPVPVPSAAEIAKDRDLRRRVTDNENQLRELRSVVEEARRVVKAVAALEQKAEAQDERYRTLELSLRDAVHGLARTNERGEEQCDRMSRIEDKLNVITNHLIGGGGAH